MVYYNFSWHRNVNLIQCLDISDFGLPKTFFDNLPTFLIGIKLSYLITNSIGIPVNIKIEDLSADSVESEEVVGDNDITN